MTNDPTLSHMERETQLFGGLTLAVILGSIVLIVGVEFMEELVIATGGAIIILSGLGLAWAILSVEEPEGVEAEPEAEEAGH